jgi:transcriptional regulator with XRE-family HTH domain
MEAVLTVLQANQQQRQEALASLRSPRTHTLLQEEIARTLRKSRMGASLGPMPRSGDLLRALRLRRGVSLEQLAPRLGVTVRTLRFWEKGEGWPPPLPLQNLCFFLGAHEEEMIALTCADARFTLRSGAEGSAGVDEGSRRAEAEEACEARLWAVVHGLTEIPALADLQYHSLETEAWRLAANNPSRRSLWLLGTIRAHYANSLSVQNRFGEAFVVAQRALDLLPEIEKQAGRLHGGKTRESRSPFWLYGGIALARAAVYRGPRLQPKRGIDQLKQWLPLAHLPEYEAWMLADIATYHTLDTLGGSAVSQSHLDAAVALSEQASQVASRSQQESPSVERFLRDVDRCRVLLAAGRPAESLSLLTSLEPQMGNSPRRAEFFLLGARTRLSLGSLSEAHDYLMLSRDAIDQFGLWYLKSQADALAERF